MVTNGGHCESAWLRSPAGVRNIYGRGGGSPYDHTDRALGRRAVDAPSPISSGGSRGGVLVLVAAAQPKDLLTLLVAADRRAVQEAVVAHGGFETARGRQVGPVDGALRADIRA